MKQQNKTADFSKDRNIFNPSGVFSPVFSFVKAFGGAYIVYLLVKASIWSFLQTDAFFADVFPLGTVDLLFFGDNVGISKIFSVVAQYGQTGFLFGYFYSKSQVLRITASIKSKTGWDKLNLESELTKAEQGVLGWGLAFYFMLAIDAGTNVGEFLTEYGDGAGVIYWLGLFIGLAFVVGIIGVEEITPMFVAFTGSNLNDVLEALGINRLAVFDIYLHSTSGVVAPTNDKTGLSSKFMPFVEKTGKSLKSTGTRKEKKPKPRNKRYDGSERRLELENIYKDGKRVSINVNGNEKASFQARDNEGETDESFSDAPVF